MLVVAGRGEVYGFAGSRHCQAGNDIYLSRIIPCLRQALVGCLEYGTKALFKLNANVRWSSRGFSKYGTLNVRKTRSAAGATAVDSKKKHGPSHMQSYIEATSFAKRNPSLGGG